MKGTRLLMRDLKSLQSCLMSTTHLPPVPDQIREQYNSLVSEVDLLVDALADRLQDHIRCAPGCSSCCRAFSLCSLEASLLATLHRSVSSVSLPRVDDRCRLLVDDRCSIYAHRPLICRTQGLPIGYVDELHKQVEVSACPLNFAENHSFTVDDLLFLDPYNFRLADLNRHYCQDNGLDVDLRLALE